MKSTRRTFIQKMGLGSLAALHTSRLLIPEEKTNPPKTILFQGDSITDGNRTRNQDWNHIMGHGYAYLIASRLWYEHPDHELMFHNRGTSGNRVKDLEDRWQPDALDLKPDLISILVGINDVGGIVRNQNPGTIEQFEATYQRLLDKTKAALPNTQIVLCEPFLLPVGRVMDNWELWQSETLKRQALTRKLAAAYQAVFVEFQTSFNEACRKASASYWIWDGIHPMPGGHELMARCWLKEVKKHFRF